MSKYTFTFKKDDIFVEFTTTDKEIVEKQFQVWVADADAYARGHKQGKGKREKGKGEANSKQQIANGKEEIGNRKLGIESVSQSESDVNLTPHSSLLTSNSLEAPSTKIEAIAEEFSVKEPPQPEIIDKASTLLKTINAIQDEEGRGKREKGKEEANGKQQTANGEEENPSTKNAPSTNFDEVLEQSIENPTFEPTKTQDKLFLNLVNSKNTTNKFHYLIITAYYLSEFEKLQRFSLKQINSKLMQNLSEVIDHTTLQEAINESFIEVVPDLTGISDVAEYKLTLAGEEFFANKI